MVDVKCFNALDLFVADFKSGPSTQDIKLLVKYVPRKVNMVAQIKKSNDRHATTKAPRSKHPATSQSIDACRNGR